MRLLKVCFKALQGLNTPLSHQNGRFKELRRFFMSSINILPCTNSVDLLVIVASSDMIHQHHKLIAMREEIDLFVKNLGSYVCFLMVRTVAEYKTVVIEGFSSLIIFLCYIIDCLVTLHDGQNAPRVS